MPLSGESGRAALRSQPRDVRQVALDLVHERLERVSEALRARDVPVPELDGKMLRPLLAYALEPPERRATLDDRFWFGALAIQMAHEASLLHDDILDGASERRGAPTICSERGVGPALVLGDHYLTGAYRAALATGSMAFLDRFIVSVERTVAGEVRQAQSAGAWIDLESYFEIVLGKSGELLGAAASLGSTLLGKADAEARASLGRQIGALYQQVDDLLDYCTFAETGKEPLQDYRQGKWTWILAIAEVESFQLTRAEILEAVFGFGAGGSSAAERALRALEVRRDGLLRAVRQLALDEDLVATLLEDWIDAARRAVCAQAEGRDRGRERHAWTSERAVAPRSPEIVVTEVTRTLGSASPWSTLARSCGS